jgi:hypothetical protein
MGGGQRSVLTASLLALRDAPRRGMLPDGQRSMRWSLQSERLRFAPLVGFFATCGCSGESTRDSGPLSDPGPVHEGKGLYDLTIERVSDDCTPQLVSGKIGPVVVVVRTNGGPEGTLGAANIPIYFDQHDPAATASRSDISFDEPLVFELPIHVVPECAELSQHWAMTTLNADGASIDVEWFWTLTGVDTCPAGYRFPSDCTSQRVFHFRWLRTCEPDDGTLDCP